MLKRESVLFWNEIDHDLYEEDGHILGIELDLYNGHQTFYHRQGNTYYDLSSDIFKAVDQFNEILATTT